MIDRAVTPHRGEIWTVELNPVRGHEQAGARPALVISANRFNRSAADLLFVVPLTRSDRGMPLHVPTILPPEGGLAAPSFAMCEMLRSVAKDRLGAAPWGQVSVKTMTKIEHILRILMQL